MKYGRQGGTSSMAAEAGRPLNPVTFVLVVKVVLKQQLQLGVLIDHFVQNRAEGYHTRRFLLTWIIRASPTTMYEYCSFINNSALGSMSKSKSCECLHAIGVGSGMFLRVCVCVCWYDRDVTRFLVSRKGVRGAHRDFHNC